MENNKNHILIVDDDNRIRDLLKDYLYENNYIVSTAENADQAKERLKYLKFGIFFKLDVSLRLKRLILLHLHRLFKYSKSFNISGISG